MIINLYKNRAVALVVVTAVLMILSAIGVCFVMHTNTERSASANYLDMVRANLVAEAGLWRSISGIRQLPLHVSHTFAQYDWTYQGNQKGTMGAGIPVEQANYPSYWWIGDQANTLPKPEPQLVYGRSVSGVVGSTYEPQGDTYTLKILDTSSQINLNSDIDSLSSILNYLGQAIAYYKGVDPISGKGAEIMQLRQNLGGKFGTKDSLSSVIGEDNLKLLADYVTVQSWIDVNTISRDKRRGAGYYTSDPRPPVNVNTAPKPVLVALLSGLSSEVSRIDFDQAVYIADKIDEQRIDYKGFSCWDHFNLFIDTLVGQENIDKARVDIIKANANPNVSIRRFNHDATAHQPVDKTDLTYHTTEFCFTPMGYFEISSLGRITGGGGKIKSSRLLTSIIKSHSVVCHTTQNHFYRDVNWMQRTAPLLENNYVRLWGKTQDDAGNKFDDKLGYVGLSFTTEYFPWDSEGSLIPPNKMTFNASFLKDFNADFAIGDSGADTNKDCEFPLALDGGLAEDGVVFQEENGDYLKYDSRENLPLEEGCVAFWLKYNDNLTVGKTTVFFSDSHLPFSSEAGIQMTMDVSVSKGFYFTANRVFYVKPGVEDSINYPYPYKYREVTVRGSLTGGNRDFMPHKWHHVVLMWKDGTDLSVNIDGGRSNGNDIVSITKTEHQGAVDLGISPNQGTPPYKEKMYIGSGPDGGAQKALTIDDIQIYSISNISWGSPCRHIPVPDKYVDDAWVKMDKFLASIIDPKDYVEGYGRFQCKFDLPHEGLKLRAVNWTVLSPVEQDSLNYYHNYMTLISLNNDFIIAGKDSGWQNPEGSILSGDSQTYMVYFLKIIKLKDPWSIGIPTNDFNDYRNDSPVMDDIILYYQGPLEILSYQFRWD